MNSGKSTHAAPPPAGHAVFRCEASPTLGNGHLRRCLTLARALAGRGWRTTFAMTEVGFAAVPGAALAGIGRVVLGGRERLGCERDVDRLVACLGGRGADLLVVDHYELDHRFETACRRFARRVAVVDDLGDREHNADLLLDQTFGRADSDYAPLVPPGCRLLCGSRYALLRPIFAQRRQEALARRQAGGPVRRILVTFGATDPDDLTSITLDALEIAAHRFACPWAIDVLLGASAPHLNAVRRRLDADPNARLHIGADGAAVAALMLSADLALGAGGTTSWERCCLGLPSLVVVTAANQATIAGNLEAAGASRTVGLGEAVDAGGLAAAIATLCDDAALRSRMSQAAAAVCDGAGTTRTVAAIEALVMTDRHSSGRAVR